MHISHKLQCPSP